MKSQVVILKIKFDDTTQHQPKSWNWSEIIGCEVDCVEVMNHGAVETIDSQTKE